jgi:flagellar hook-associated protein 1
MASLIAAQRAYEASARVLTVVDSLIGTLIERTGLAGR